MTATTELLCTHLRGKALQDAVRQRGLKARQALRPPKQPRFASTHNGFTLLDEVTVAAVVTKGLSREGDEPLNVGYKDYKWGASKDLWFRKLPQVARGVYLGWSKFGVDRKVVLYKIALYSTRHSATSMKVVRALPKDVRKVESTG